MSINRSRNNIPILAETQYTQTSQTITAVSGLAGFQDANSITFQCKFAAVGSTAGDLLQVFIQASVDGGTTYTDIAASTDLAESVIGNGSTIYEYLTVTRGIDPGSTNDVFQRTTESLTAGTTRNVNWGDLIRVRVVLTEGTALDITLTITANTNVI